MQLLIDIGMMCLMVAVIPQLIKTYKNRKSLKDVDFKFSFLTFVGNIFAIVWSIIFKQFSIGLLNVIYGIWTSLSIYWLVKFRRLH